VSNPYILGLMLEYGGIHFGQQPDNNMDTRNMNRKMQNQFLLEVFRIERTFSIGHLRLEMAPAQAHKPV